MERGGFSTGDVVNSTLYTDIVASINNYNIESYNIDGYTAIKDKSKIGKKYTNGLSFGGFYYSGDNPYALFNLNGNYKNLTCDLGYLDISPVDGLDASKKCTVSFIVDGVNVKEYSVSINDLPKNVTVPINNGMQLKILISNYKSYLGIGNMTVK